MPMISDADLSNMTVDQLRALVRQLQGGGDQAAAAPAAPGGGGQPNMQGGFAQMFGIPLGSGASVLGGLGGGGGAPNYSVLADLAKQYIR